ncbi:MAG: NYN domain-containing protein [Nitrososphaerales archaeon]
MHTNIYIDGFNFYYGCLKGTPYRWLNFETLGKLVFPKHDIQRIRYFTARVNPSPNDPQKPQRQAAYFRALQTIPCLTLHYGTFLSHSVQMPLAHPVTAGSRFAEVTKTEEKGSDVNLATYLLVDGFQNDYEQAIVVSNDSDLMEPIRQVRQVLGLTVGVLNPQRDEKKTSWILMHTADFYRRIRPGALQASLFPPTLTDANGTIVKPAGW